MVGRTKSELGAIATSQKRNQNFNLMCFNLNLLSASFGWSLSLPVLILRS